MSDRALLIAVNSYRHVPDLRGCVPDQQDIARLLTETYQFGPGTIRLLTDGDAVAHNVADGLAWLADGARASDRRLLHFSGHGSLVADRSGDEASGYDSCLALHDLDWSPGTYLLDDEIGAWIRSLPLGVRLVVLIDACHSGTSTRAIEPAAAGVIGGPLAVPLALDAPREDVALARFVAPPAGVRAEAARKARIPRAAAGGPDLLALTACRDDQTAADAWLGGGYRGAFSYFLGRALRARPLIGRAELHRRVAADLARARFEQVPQLESMPARGGLFGATARAGR